MEITNNAKALLIKMLQDEQKDGLSFELVGTGCHPQLMIDFVTKEMCNDEINGIMVFMPQEASDYLHDVILDTNMNHLVFRTNSPCCGCGSEDGCGCDESSGCGSSCQ